MYKRRVLYSGFKKRGRPGNFKFNAVLHIQFCCTFQCNSAKNAIIFNNSHSVVYIIQNHRIFYQLCTKIYVLSLPKTIKQNSTFLAKKAVCREVKRTFARNVKLCFIVSSSKSTCIFVYFCCTTQTGNVSWRRDIFMRICV